MNKKIKLSERLKAISTYISPGSYFADIGTDHAYLPCYICQIDSTARAIASDVSEGPYKRALKTVTHYRLNDRIDVELAHGLNSIKSDVNEVIIAGMGGRLIEQIIEDGAEKLIGVKKLIAQPNNHAYHVRQAFHMQHFSLIDEMIIEENEHIYEILVATKNEKNCYDPNINMDIQYKFGPKLMKEKSSIFIKKWQNEYEKIKQILISIQHAKNNENERIIQQFKQELQWIEEVIN